MEYSFKQDLKAIRDVMNLSQEELADKLGVEQITISRNEQGHTKPSDKLMEKVYVYAFENNIKLNRLKEMLWSENLKSSHRLLFHGAKERIMILVRDFIQEKVMSRPYHLFLDLSVPVYTFWILTMRI